MIYEANPTTIIDDHWLSKLVAFFKKHHFNLVEKVMISLISPFPRRDAFAYFIARIFEPTKWNLFGSIINGVCHSAAHEAEINSRSRQISYENPYVKLIRRVEIQSQLRVYVCPILKRQERLSPGTLSNCD